ncbi:hypothetical protein [Kangiella sp. HZ709]|uniref:hypothetical protein n=1 Tax=Kangiella sp. HZ709 TaxID=2666328 RepID=UPI0012AFC857|nr:hypothetical protein [Kangiella sp. HZ709]MRX27036.1 hypothetical protein [Kangiella sp. HZ709]
MRKVLVLLITLFFSSSCVAEETKNSNKKLDDFLFRLESRMICPQYPTASPNSFEAKMCGRFVTYYKKLDIVHFDYLVFNSSSFLNDFEQLDAEGKENSMLNVLDYLSTYTGNRKMEGIEQYFGIIQRTSHSNISELSGDVDKSIKSFVQDKTSVMVTYFDRKNRKWYSAYGTAESSSYLVSNKPTTIVDFLKVEK